MMGGDLVAAALQLAGVEVVFGIPSVHNLPIYEGLRRAGTIRLVTVRHEQAAAGAADGYARVTGRVGVFLTSTGPGAANAMGGIFEARTSGSPVVHLTGQIDHRHLGKGRGFIHEAPGQPAMLTAVSKHFASASSPSELGVAVARAIATAFEAPRGPVSLEIPIDYQYAPVEPAAIEAVTAYLAELDGAERARGEARLDPTALEAAIELLRGARRPLFLVGGGAAAASAGAELDALVQWCHAGVLTTPNGRGVLPESHPLVVGNLAWEPAARQLSVDADLLVAVGTRFQGPNTDNWTMELPRRVLQIDVDPTVPGRSYPVTVALIADAAVALAACRAGLGDDEASTDPAWPERVAQARDAAHASLRGVLGAQEGLLARLEARLEPTTIVVKDATIPAYTWGNRLLRVEMPRTSVMPNGFAIGLGLCHALGAATAVQMGATSTAAATPDGGADASPAQPVVLIVGDGGFMLAAGELASYAAEQLPVVVLLFDDGGYGILRNIQQRQFQATVGVELGRPDFVQLARALGVPARRVTTVDAYDEALGEALGSRGPRLVSIDLEAIGPMAVPYTGTSRPPAP